MTSRLMKTLAATVLLVGLSAMPAAAQSFTLTAKLTGAGEATPTLNGINTGAFGDATIVVNMSTRTVTYTVNVFNLPSGVIASHIHVGAEGTPGPVVVNFTVPTNASNDFGFTGSVVDTAFVLRPDQGIRSADDMFQAILGGNSYVNVHSAVNPGGEIRGQLVLQK
jgi:CHRD domain